MSGRAGALARRAAGLLLLATACKRPPADARVEHPLHVAPRPTAAAISERDLMTRLYAFADDSMLGREAGTVGNVRATDYLAAEAARVGLRPAGEGGTYFQTVAAVRGSAPARNVVAVLPGADPRLRAQYVALGAHSDHAGLAPPAARDSLRADSVYNGADDDGSGSVALLEIAEALAAAPERPRRSVLFVWHTAEELGMVGSRWFTQRPTVPLDSVVAQINLDMIGRGGAGDVPGGGPRHLQVIGARRLSRELGDLVVAVNQERAVPFALDWSWDARDHPEHIYCRSDHYMYARRGIPVAFFMTGLHRDYHQRTDEPRFIDYAKLAAVTGYVRDLVVRIANRDARPRVDRAGDGGC